MQIKPNLSTYHARSDFPLEEPALAAPRSFARRLSTSNVLDVEVSEDPFGLRLIKIGDNSPLLRLAPLGDFTLQGAMEIGDRIVAINGVFSFRISDLDSLVFERPSCEITIFDYRTRLTVSWNLKTSELSPRV
jgi:hypothetical protein